MVCMHTYTHTQWTTLSHEKECNFAICNNTDGLGGYSLSKITQTEKDIFQKGVLSIRESKKYKKPVKIIKKEAGPQT